MYWLKEILLPIVLPHAVTLYVKDFKGLRCGESPSAAFTSAYETEEEKRHQRRGKGLSIGDHNLSIYFHFVEDAHVQTTARMWHGHTGRNKTH